MCKSFFVKTPVRGNCEETEESAGVLVRCEGKEENVMQCKTVFDKARILWPESTTRQRSLVSDSDRPARVSLPQSCLWEMWWIHNAAAGASVLCSEIWEATSWLPQTPSVLKKTHTCYYSFIASWHIEGKIWLQCGAHILVIGFSYSELSWIVFQKLETKIDRFPKSPEADLQSMALLFCLKWFYRF